MKRILMVVWALLLILSGCSGKNPEMERLLLLRHKLANGNGSTFVAYITADYVDELYSFALDCKSDSSGNILFTVLEPQSIAGISGEITAEKGALTFDENILAFSLLADGQLTPVSVPWIMMKSLLGGYIKGCGTEGEYVRAIIDDSFKEDPIQVQIWLDSDDRPVNADFLWQGRRIIAMEVKNFQHL